MAGHRGPYHFGLLAEMFDRSEYRPATPPDNRLLPPLVDARCGVSGRGSLGAGQVHAVLKAAVPVEVLEAGSAAFVRYLDMPVERNPR